MSIPAFLTNSALRLLLFGGKGGVGKTTCATATAWRLARERPVLLLSTDPAHSLRDSLADVPLPKSMEVVEFDAGAYLDEFRRRHGQQLQAIAERGTFLDSEDISRFLSLSLPGMDELFGFLDIARRTESADAASLTVVDTAPTGHTLRLLAMSELLRQWVDVLETLLAKHHYMKQLFGRAAPADELDRFIQELTASIDAAQALLTDPARSRFVPVMLAEALSVRETAGLLDELDRLQIPSEEIVVNMLAPSSRCPVCRGTHALQMRELRELPPAFERRTLWGTALRPQEVRSSEVETFWEDVRPLDPHAASDEPEAAMPMPPHPVRHPATLPPASLKLLLVGGKGGVGKTTLACATALRLAREAPHRKILLFSTDPAHSVGDCLDLPIGSQPTPVVDGLMAMEIDAQAELDALKQQYLEELHQFFGAVLRGLDAPFDRAVMERIIDLSPPGLDEIMALSRAMDFLSEQTCDVLVLDTAPTGHLLRLLEMPEVVSSWLKAFFEVLLKYREVFGVPTFSDRLVKLSKDLHRFRALLRDPERAALYAVSIPTRMALEETQDLLAACGRMHVSVPVLFLNTMTPPNDCPFCTERARQEQEIATTFRQVFSGHQAWVFRQPEPRGRDRLEELGQRLYRSEGRGGERSGENPPQSG